MTHPPAGRGERPPAEGHGSEAGGTGVTMPELPRCEEASRSEPPPFLAQDWLLSNRFGARKGYSITTTTSPEPTDWPAVTLTSLTVPDLSAAMLFSIFIASRTHTVWPASTSSP